MKPFLPPRRDRESKTVWRVLSPVRRDMAAAAAVSSSDDVMTDWEASMGDEDHDNSNNNNNIDVGHNEVLLHQNFADRHNEIFADDLTDDGDINNNLSNHPDWTDSDGAVAAVAAHPHVHTGIGFTIPQHRSIRSDSSTASVWSRASATSTSSFTSCGIGSVGFWDDGTEIGNDDVTGIPDVVDVGIPPPNLADSLIAQQLSQLSMQERQNAYFDVHGVRDEVAETPVMLYENIEKMKHHLQQLVEQDCAEAYEVAMQQNSFYCHRQDFLTKFLRAELMDPAQAALRLARYFETKLELFGVNKLTVDITQDDLESDPDDMRTLYSGQSQILAKRDRAGRAIVFWNGAIRDDFPASSKLKRQFYLAQMISEDGETQKKGVVHVYISNLSSSSLDTTYAWKETVAGRSQPIRVEAFHFCIDDAKSKWGNIFDTFKMAMHPFLKVRIKTHTGNYQECLSALQTYGIPIQEFPLELTESGEGGPAKLVVNTEYHVEMVTKRRERERRYKALIDSKQPQPLLSVSLEPPTTLAKQFMPQQRTTHHQAHQFQQQQQQHQYPQITVPPHQQQIVNMFVPTSVSFVPSGADSLSIYNSTVVSSSAKPIGKQPAEVTSSLSSLPTSPIGVGSSTAFVASGKTKPKKRQARHKYSAVSSVAGVCIPSRNDVLFGRGKRFQNHIGNQRFRMLIDDCLPTYENASKDRKTQIAQEIVGIVHQARGRFLKDDGAGWAQVTDLHLLRQKVAHAFRGLRSQKQIQVSQAIKPLSSGAGNASAIGENVSDAVGGDFKPASTHPGEFPFSSGGDIGSSP